jgi:hypothetical protein
MDSPYYNGKAITACRDLGACFSVTMRMDPKVRRRITQIPGHQWAAIKYPHAIWDDDEKAWISDAEVAEIGYPAFTSDKARTVTARMIVRRVRRLNPRAGQGQQVLPGMPDEITYRYHPVFTDSPHPMLAAEEEHRDHAICEQGFADIIDGPLAHLHRPTSAPTQPGRSWPRSPRTSCAPPGRWPRCFTPGPAAPPSAAT